jgi:hypothetical protein
MEREKVARPIEVVIMTHVEQSLCGLVCGKIRIRDWPATQFLNYNHNLTFRLTCQMAVGRLSRI